MRLRSMLDSWISRLSWNSAVDATPAIPKTAVPSARVMSEHAFDRMETMIARQRSFGLSLNPPPPKPMPQPTAAPASIAVEDLGDLLSLASPLMAKREPRLIRV